MKKLIQYLSLDKLGFLEFLFAITPILIGYGLNGFPLSVLMYLILLVVAFFKRKKHPARYAIFKPIVILLLYVLFHDFVLVAFLGKNFNGLLSTILCLYSIIYIAPILENEKLKGSLNLVSVISILGLLFQYGLILLGHGVHPIELPFLEMAGNRLEGESLRPSSFFMEPAAYSAFMFVPMMVALKERHFLWLIILIFFVFMTGSTTGLLASFIMIAVFMMTQNLKKKYILIVLSIGVLMTFGLQNVSIFEVGMEKLQETDVETNVRISQGPYVVSTMNASEYIAGVFYNSALDYCTQRAPGTIFKNDAVFISSFWLILLIYGVIGLVLYLNVYWQIIRRAKFLLPLIGVLIAIMFSSSLAMGPGFAFTATFLISQMYCGEEPKFIE